MRIKEVEELTGLTAKAIRLYESKGLLTVARQEENKYRDYTQEDVQRLRTIAVLRKLDISIREIKQWVDGEVELADLLHRISAEAMLEAEKADERIRLANELAKMLDKHPDMSIPDAIEEVEFLKELYSFLDEIRDGVRADLYWPILSTLAAVLNSVWTVIQIQEGITDQALIFFSISMVLVVNSVYRWYRYCSIDRHRRRKGCLWMIPVGLVAIVVAFAVMFLISGCQLRFFAPDTGWYVFRTPWCYISLLYPVLLIMAPFLDWQEDKEMEAVGETPEEKPKPTIRSWVLVIAFNLFLFYACLTGVTYYSEGQFIRHTILHPMGKSYDVSDIDKVEAGFRGKWDWDPLSHEGDFYYKITFSDGTTENWVYLCSCSDSESDPWEDLLEFDRTLMDAGVEKISDWEHREDFQYDQSCLDICDAILNNQ